MYVMRRYVTLIELLVVIAIIVILSGIYLPAIKNIRKNGRSSSCMGNILQIDDLLMIFSADYNDFTVSTDHKKQGVITGRNTYSLSITEKSVLTM